MRWPKESAEGRLSREEKVERVENSSLRKEGIKKEGGVASPGPMPFTKANTNGAMASINQDISCSDQYQQHSLH
jgi:hypothetical protein